MTNDIWELWVRESDTLRLHFKACYSRDRARAEADQWQEDGYKVSIYPANSIAQGIHEAETARIYK